MRNARRVGKGLPSASTSISIFFPLAKQEMSFAINDCFFEDNVKEEARQGNANKRAGEKTSASHGKAVTAAGRDDRCRWSRFFGSAIMSTSDFCL